MQRDRRPKGAPAAVRSRRQPWMTVDHQASQAWLLRCRAHASARWPSWHDFGASDDQQHEERFYWTCPLAWMMSALPAGESQPASACSCRVIATLTDLVCASCLCTQLARHPGGGVVERASELDGSRRNSKHARQRDGSMGASAALGRSGVQNSVMCLSRRLVLLMMRFVCVFDISWWETWMCWHGT